MRIDSNKIEQTLALRKMTQADLASKSGISRQSVCTLIKRGSCKPDTAGKLAEGLDIPVEQILIPEVPQ